MMMYQRLIKQQLDEALREMPVVLLVGPRRAGKTTLVREIEKAQRRFVTLDDPGTLVFAKEDPLGFIRNFNIVTIDEVQRAPELILAIKKSVDNDERYGRFLLTGSAHIFSLPQVMDSLAGRVRILTLYPLSRNEILNQPSTFLDRVYHHKFCHHFPAQNLSGTALIKTALSGGYPDAVRRLQEPQRLRWMNDYITSTINRDLRDISAIGRRAEFPKFFKYVAAYSGKVVNYSQFGSHIDISYKTAQHYIDLLEKIFFLTLLPSWHTHRLKRLIKKPKLHFVDSGLLATTLGITYESIQANRALWGSLLESFVVSEILKLIAVSPMMITLYHFRQNERYEVDLILERHDGMVVGIEVKAKATIKPQDFKGLRLLQATCKLRFSAGIILCDCEEMMTYGEKLYAAPISSLWQ